MGSWMAIAMMPVFFVLGRGCHLVGLIRLVEVKGKRTTSSLAFMT